MKKYLITNEGNFYKANLHCHTTISDGRMTPEEVKNAYKEQGYSIVAYTDHDVFIPHPELCEDGFLALNGFEVEINHHTSKIFEEIQTCHICAVALDPSTEIQPCFHRSEYAWGNALEWRKKVKFNENEPDFIREYNGECITKMMNTFRDSGFFVTYNHPVWSMENYENYMGYNGMHAMEMINYGCIATGYMDRNEPQYDDMLRGGKRIYCIAADDNHNLGSSFGGYTMIKAEKLEYKTITKALVDGNFYCSEHGPAIKELYVEDGKVVIKTEGAREIYIARGIRRAGRLCDENCNLTEASFTLYDNDIYFRLVVVGKDGKCSYTNAYFIDEVLAK